MRRCVDLSGKRFGKLTAQWPVGRDNHWHVVWFCSCDCGRLIMVHVGNLNRAQSNTKSCGCLRKEVTKLSLGESGFNALYGEYQSRARKKRFSFELTKDQFKKLTSALCFYCGQPPSQRVKVGKGWGTYTYNGVDRLRNKEGYVTGNVVPCCRTCNWMKGTLGNFDFIHQCRKIVERTREVL